MANVTAPEIRAAKKFLSRRGFTSEELSPRRFALAAKSLDTGFRETLAYLGNVYDDQGTTTEDSEGAGGYSSGDSQEPS